MTRLIEPPKEKAENIHRLISSLQYGYFTPVNRLILRSILEYIRPVPEDEKVGFPTVKTYTRSWYLLEELKEAYSERNMEDKIKELLLDEEQYEILAKF